MVLPSGAAIIVYSPSGIGTDLVLQPNSSPKKPWAFLASCDTYSNQTKRPVGIVMGDLLLSGFAQWSNDRGADRQRSTASEKKLLRLRDSLRFRGDVYRGAGAAAALAGAAGGISRKP